MEIIRHECSEQRKSIEKFADSRNMGMYLYFKRNEKKFRGETEKQAIQYLKELLLYTRVRDYPKCPPNDIEKLFDEFVDMLFAVTNDDFSAFCDVANVHMQFVKSVEDPESSDFGIDREVETEYSDDDHMLI